MDVKTKIQAELERIEEDCIYSGKSHFNAGVRWGRYHYVLGVPAVLLAAVAATAFQQEANGLASVVSTVSAVLTALITFLKPSERASAHKGSGDQYLVLRNDARIFREIQLSHVCDEQSAINGLDEFTKRRNDLNLASLQFSDSDFKKARQGIEEGEAKHKVDN